MSPLEAVLIFVLSAGAAVVQSLTGLGFGLMIVPPLVLVIGAKHAVVVSNALGTLLSMVMLSRSHADVEWRMGSSLLAGSALGMPLGLAVLVAIDPDALQVVIAVTVIVFAALLARGLRLHAAGLAGDIATGVVSGILRMSTSMSGPPVVIYLQGRGIPSAPFRATLAAFFTISGVAGVTLLALGGQFSREALYETAVGVPALAAGLIGGNRLYHAVDERLFRRLVLGVLFVSSVLSLVAVFVG
ncbi:MAG: sulfite exporter TauE/SafE family protein [Dehalococcoidia bacterium]|nr:sulfite exporter TauE/SafE family protein [Dehalococcoidia bacterium]